MTYKPTSKFWKFCPVDQNSLSVLINEEVWFSHPDQFNDPFDCNIDFDCVLEDLKSYEPDPKIHEIVHKWLKPVKNDESGYYVYSVIKEKYDEVLMWSHYANKHKGICLGFSLDSFEPNTRIDEMGDVFYRDVEYIDSLKKGLQLAKEYHAGSRGSVADAFKQITDLDNALWFKAVEMRLRTKAPKWEYENEYRFIIQGEYGNKKGDLVPIVPKDLTSIIYGLNCDSKDQKTIDKIIASKGWNHISRWKARRGKGLFDLHFELLNK